MTARHRLCSNFGLKIYSRDVTDSHFGTDSEPILIMPILHLNRFSSDSDAGEESNFCDHLPLLGLNLSNLNILLLDVIIVEH